MKFRSTDSIPQGRDAGALRNPGIARASAERYKAFGRRLKRRSIDPLTEQLKRARECNRPVLAQELSDAKRYHAEVLADAARADRAAKVHEAHNRKILRGRDHALRARDLARRARLLAQLNAVRTKPRQRAPRVSVAAVAQAVPATSSDAPSAEPAPGDEDDPPPPSYDAALDAELVRLFDPSEALCKAIWLLAPHIARDLAEAAVGRGIKYTAEKRCAICWTPLPLGGIPRTSRADENITLGVLVCRPCQLAMESVDDDG